MAISLKDLYDQVQNIKGSGLSIVSENRSATGHIEFSNGLIINWGISGSIYDSSWDGNYSKPFKSAILSITATAKLNSGSYSGNCAIYAYPTSLTKVRISNDTVDRATSATAYYTAIGYLISNRITSLLEVLL